MINISRPRNTENTLPPGRVSAFVMTKIIAAIFTFIFLLAANGSAFGQSGRAKPSPTPTPDDDPISIRTQEVKLNVSAIDEHGKFYGGVQPDDLFITENDVLHQVQTLRRVPANVLIVMDTGGEMRKMKSLDRTRRIAQSVIAALQPDDAVAVMQYSDTAEIIAEWTSDKAEAMKAVGSRSKFGRRSAFVSGLELASRFLMREGLENKHLVLITDGTDSFYGSGEKQAALRSMLATDINVHVLSYTRLEIDDLEPRTKTVTNTPPPKAMPDEIAAQLPNARNQPTNKRVGPTINLDRKMLRTIRSRKADLEESERQLTALADDTNGIIIIAESLDELEEKAAVVARTIDSSYVITYVPKVPLGEPGTAAVRKIEVHSRRPGLIVQAQRRLIVEPDERPRP